MRLTPSVLLSAFILPCVRTAGLTQPEDSCRTEHINKRLDKLLSIDRKLSEELDNASLDTEGFLSGRNETSFHRTIEIISGNIRLREEFIAQVNLLIEGVTHLANVSFPNEVRVTKELNFTKDELSKPESVMALHKKLLKLNDTNEKVNGLTQQLQVEGRSAINITAELMEETRSFIHEVSDVRNLTSTHNLTEVITNLCNERLLGGQHREHDARNRTEHSPKPDRTKIPIMFDKYIRPSLFVIIFVVGLAENGVLIAIFARYPKIREYRNLIILNLSIADTLSLILNLPVMHMYESMSSWDASLATVQIFMFYRFLCFGLGVFSVVGLCLRRFSTTLKLSARSGFILRQSTKHSSILLIAAVWVSAIVFAIPHGFYGCIYFEACFNTNVVLYYKIAKAIFVIDLIFLSIIPTVAITTLYWFTVRHLKLRTQQLPVDMPEHQRMYQIRVLSRSRNIVILTPIVFAVTSLPYYVYIVVNSFLGTDINSASYVVLILYCLTFVNCSFNPAALYFTSGTFRHYVKMHFFWCERKENNGCKRNSTKRDLSNTVEYRAQNTVETCP